MGDSTNISSAPRASLHSKQILDEQIVITSFKPVTPTPKTGGYSFWPNHYATRTTHWRNSSEEMRAERLKACSGPVGTDNTLPTTKDEWIKSLLVGGGWPQASAWVAGVMERKFGPPPEFTN